MKLLMSLSEGLNTTRKLRHLTNVTTKVVKAFGELDFLREGRNHKCTSTHTLEA
jgi:hypothetical protein